MTERDGGELRPTGPQAYSPKDVAALANVPVSQVYKAIASGELAHVQIGKHYRISHSAYCAWIGQDAGAAAIA